MSTTTLGGAASSFLTTSVSVAGGSSAIPCASIFSGPLVVEAVTPMALEMALAVQPEMHARLDEADRLRHRQVERAQ